MLDISTKVESYVVFSECFCHAFHSSCFAEQLVKNITLRYFSNVCHYQNSYFQSYGSFREVSVKMQLQRCSVVHVSIVKLMQKSKQEEIISNFEKHLLEARQTRIMKVFWTIVIYIVTVKWFWQSYLDLFLQLKLKMNGAQINILSCQIKWYL